LSDVKRPRGRPKGVKGRRKGPTYPEVDLTKDPRKVAITEDILSGMSIRDVAAKHRTHANNISRFINKQLSLAIHDSELRSRLDSAEGIRGKLTSHLERIDKLFDACEEFLQDPDNPERYYLGPRAQEVRVVYYTRDDNGKRVKESAMLDELLARAGDKIEVDQTGFEVTDPRKVILATAQVATKQLEVLARLVDGAAKIEGNSPVTSSEAWTKVQQVIINVVKDDPTMLALIERLEGHMDGLVRV